MSAASGSTFDSVAPSTGEVLAEVSACGPEDVDRAVQSAAAAFERGVWRSLKPRDRKQVLLRFADLVSQHAAEIAYLDCVDAGKPIVDCETSDLPDVEYTLRWYAEAVDKVFGKVAPTGDEYLGLVTREPIGVVGAVLPWNFPAATLAWKLGPALAAGNSLVVKPAEQAPLSALRLAELAAEAGLPEGVLNVVPGLGEVAGKALGLSMDVDAVTFTGSGEVGREFLRYSADSNLKRVVLECGGKSPQIVMPDIGRDLEFAIGQLATAGFMNSGQNCTCGSRVLAHESVHDAVVAGLISSTAAWKVGDPLDRGTRIGPVIELQALERILGFIDEAVGMGAVVFQGGKRVLQDTGGWFIELTIIANVTPQMRIAREEVFGPVVSVLRFSDEAEAIALANDSDYGLAASIFTHDLNTAHRMARVLRAGTVSGNCYSEGDITTPFGGYKLSGFGGRDKGLEAFDQYTELKTTWFDLRS